jgi:Rha family phage regulatory protein
VTTSLEVARIFVKSHYNVLKAIRSREIPEEFSGVHFEFVEIIEKMHSGMLINKSYFKMTRDGFNLIAMGFTGGRAMLHKVDWINAFNAVVAELDRMKKEEWLRLNGPAPQPQIEAPQPQLDGPDQVERPGLQPLYKCARCKQYLPLGSLTGIMREPPRGSHGAGNAIRIGKQGF